eukprot:CAMPEP_0197591656 /NCGR_PEP_ID=MMETSP1326-20131121/13838_1 /TAXON_ID=1155430 /ORGANISM="Genus nov. species nov., Strain RCC2288" /LENGTH=361 /DNA_ID=CAMNT_0043157195 /DNA_START=165 /DNA_END=1250 /DNA_ORIENTATION=-
MAALSLSFAAPLVSAPAARASSSRRGMSSVVRASVKDPVVSEVSIRRRPPNGLSMHNVGTENGSPGFAFKMEAINQNGERIENTDNKPRNILEEIVWSKDEELVRRKEKFPLELVRTSMVLAPPPRDFVGAIKEQFKATGQPALIAEVKKASPSKGVIQPNFDPVKIGKAYEAGGAACLSVLTDEKFFQGGFENLELIRSSGVTCPLLCKEFIVDAYQIYLARKYGADAILLIAAVLPNKDLMYFQKIAKSVGMASLIEVHTYEEMERVLKLDDIQLLGINNRDLGTFEVSLNVTVDLMAGPLGDEVRRRGITVVGESGIFTIDDVNVLQKAGVGCLLVGESLVKQDSPEIGIKKMYGRPL